MGTKKKTSGKKASVTKKTPPSGKKGGKNSGAPKASQLHGSSKKKGGTKAGASKMRHSLGQSPKKKQETPKGQAPPPGYEDHHPNYYDFHPPPQSPKEGQAVHPESPPPHGQQYYYPPPGSQAPPGYPPPQAFMRPDYDGTKWFNGFGSHFRKVDAFKTLGETWDLFKKIWAPLLGFFLTFTLLFLLPLILVIVGIVVFIMVLTGFDPEVMMFMQVALIIPMLFFNIILATISAFGQLGLAGMVDKYIKTKEIKWTDGYAHIRDNFGLFLKMGFIYAVLYIVLSYVAILNLVVMLFLMYFHASVVHTKNKSFIENVKNSVRFAVDQNAILFSLLMFLVSFVSGMILVVLLTVVIIIVMVIVIMGVIFTSGALVIVGIILGIVVFMVYMVLASAVGVFTTTGNTYCYVKYRWGYGDDE